LSFESKILNVALLTFFQITARSIRNLVKAGPGSSIAPYTIAIVMILTPRVPNFPVPRPLKGTRMMDWRIIS